MDTHNVLVKMGRHIFSHAVFFLLIASGVALFNDVRAAPGVDGPRTITAANTVINAYTRLAVAATAGATSIRVANVNNLATTNEGSLAAGDLLMLYQAQGATIDTSDTASYGAITNYNNSGQYEFVTVQSIVTTDNPDTINIVAGAGRTCSGLTYSYTTAAQVIRVPQYTTLTVNSGGSITASAWTGTTGGVVAVNVLNLATINGSVNVTGQGFRGGVAADRTVNFGQTGFRYTDANLGAEKGESIAGNCTLYNSSLNGCYGRGAPANGGGGGDNHNSGGGGGANGANGNTWTGMGNPDTSTTALQTAWACDVGTAGGGIPAYFNNGAGGGRGGYTYSANQNDPQTVCPGNTAWGGDNRRQVGGYGGRPLDTSSGTRFFFGGGGGAGEMNDGNGGSGGRGGGLVFIVAGSFAGSGSIQANGANGASTIAGGNDAPGGGGGGGTIVLAGGTVASTLTLSANGGAGGNQSINTNEAEGPGGGGGGGVIAITGGIPTRTANGGANGTTNSPGLNPLFAPNGATRGWNGQPGAVAPNLNSPQFCGLTPAVISAFRVGGDGIVEWETASEVGTVGFNLLRQDPVSGEFARVNDGLLPGLLTAPHGGVYRYLDRAVAPGQTYSYLLEEIEANGDARSHGPFTVIADAGRSLASADTIQTRATTVAEATPRADGYERTAHAPNGRTVPPLAARQPAAATRASTPRTAVRIHVEQEGVYAVNADQLASELGADPQQVRTWIVQGKLRLRNKGQSVAWKADPGGERLYFYGQAVQGVDGVYTRFNVYWLDNANGLVMNVLSGQGPSGVGAQCCFPSSIHVEENHFPAPLPNLNPDADFWYWDYAYMAVNDPGQVAQLTVPTPGAASTGTVTLRAHLQGSTALAPAGAIDHHVRLRVNGAEVGQGAWAGIAPYELTATFGASSLFADHNNTVTVSAELDPNVSLSAFNVNSLDISYPRAYRAADDRLRLRGEGNPVVTVDGFSDSHIAVLDISDPRKPQWLAATTVAPPGNGYSVNFVPATPNTTYFAAVPAVPVFVEGDTPSTLITKSNGVDYLVLAPASLRSGADALTDYRKGTGYSTQVVELQDIYDEFNDGIANPNAIRDFLRYAYRQWQPQPRFVALVGKGTFDPKDYLGFGTNRFPMLMAQTPSGLFVSDNRYVDFNDDGKSELAVGRISALTDADMRNYVAKLQAYENGSGSQPPTTALLVADNPDAAGNFTAESKAVAQKLGAAGLKPVPVHLQDLQIQEARQQIINALLAGVNVFNYIGHGSTTQLADEGLLLKEDVGQLTNQNHLPVFLAFTCGVGYGSYPGWDSLTETLLWQQDAGSVAAFAPTGLSDDSQAHVLNLSLVKALFGPGANPILGDAANAARASLAKQGGQRYMLDIYQVFGDPALQVHP